MRHSRLGQMLVLVAVLVLSAALPAVAAERGDDSNRKSKNGKTEGSIDGVSIVLEFGQPKVKERTLWGDLVPYGKVWRTGADEATKVTFGSDVAVEGKNLAAGTYSLFTIPEESGWTVIFNKAADQWGAYSYDAGMDALRVEVKARQAEHAEEMDFVIEGSEIVLRWGATAVPVTVSKAR